MPSAATLVQLGGTALLNIALAMQVGAVVSSMGSHGTRAAPGPGPRWGLHILIVGAVLALVGSAMLLWWQAAAMADVPLADAWPAVGPVLMETHVGRAWRVGAAAIVWVLALGLWARATGRMVAALRLAGLGVAVFAGSRSAVSHASGGELGWYALVDGLHLLLISLWVGEVFMALTWLPASGPDRQHPTGPLAARRLARLSSTATWALAGVCITGALLSWNGLGGQPRALFTSTYGWALMAKLGLVAVAIALGGYNRWVSMPPLLAALASAAVAPRACWSRFVTVLRLEAAVLLVVMLAAAVLATRPPAGAS